VPVDLEQPPTLDSENWFAADWAILGIHRNVTVTPSPSPSVNHRPCQPPLGCQPVDRLTELVRREFSPRAMVARRQSIYLWMQ
jgi:hypothetical protein